MRPTAATEYLEITADDGVRLATDYYRTDPEDPEGPVREPAGTANGPALGAAAGTVLIRTPYGRAHYRDQAGGWRRAGFDVLVQDVRGRYDSDGDWRPYCKEGLDGAATATYLASSGLLRGPLILAGASYDAHCALEAARELERAMTGPTPHAVVTMVPALGLFETARQPDGSPRWRDRIGWWHQHGFGRESQAPLDEAELDRRCHLAEIRGPGWVAEGLIDDAEYGPGSRAKWRRLWSAAPVDLPGRYGQMNTPLLVISGCRDFFSAEALDVASAWGRDAPRSRVQTLWGPWGHGLTNDLDKGRVYALREQGGLMARIRNFLNAPDEVRHSALIWEPVSGPEPTGYRWMPTTPDKLRTSLPTNQGQPNNAHQANPLPAIKSHGEP